MKDVAWNHVTTRKEKRQQNNAIRDRIKNRLIVAYANDSFNKELTTLKEEFKGREHFISEAVGSITIETEQMKVENGKRNHTEMVKVKQQSHKNLSQKSCILIGI